MSDVCKCHLKPNFSRNELTTYIHNKFALHLKFFPVHCPFYPSKLTLPLQMIGGRAP